MDVVAHWGLVRPYHTEYTGSRLITEVKPVLGLFSTWMGDHLGATGVVGSVCFDFFFVVVVVVVFAL